MTDGRRDVYARLSRGHFEMYRGFAIEPQPLSAMLAKGLELVELAASPDAAGCSERICAYDMLICVYDQLDHRGFAGQILRVCDRLLAEVEPAQQCFYCLSNQRANTLRVIGRVSDARVACDQVLASLTTPASGRVSHGTFFAEHHRLGMLLLAGLLADDAGDRVEAARLLAAVEPRAHRLAPTFLARYYLLKLRASRPLLDIAAGIGDDARRTLPANGHPLAEVCFEVGHELWDHGAHRTAIHYADHAKQIADYLGALSLQVATRQLLASAYARSGAPDQAAALQRDAAEYAEALARLHARPPVELPQPRQVGG